MTAPEPKAESVATFGYGGCLTPGAVYATHIGTGQLSVSVDYGRELPIGDADAERLDGEIHVAVERALAPYWGELGRDTSAETVDPYDGLSPYGIAVTALERILELDTGWMGWDEARGIASEAHGLAVAVAAHTAGKAGGAAPGLRDLVADWRKTADSLKDRHGAGDARERNTLGVVIGQVEAILAEPQAEPADVRPRADGQRGLDITCGSCGEDYGTNVTDLDEIGCVECDARRCPHCKRWFGGQS